MTLPWLLWTAGALLIALLAVCRLGVFVLCRRAGLNPPLAPAVRAVLWLIVLFALPRLLPSPLLCLGALLALFTWESAAWVRQPHLVKVTH